VESDRSDRRAFNALWLVGEEVVVIDENDRSGAISQVQLGEDMVDVGLHRTFTNKKGSPD
jgi:hypothetical protein